MNIIEAIKSGKPFKRHAWSYFRSYSNSERIFSMEDVLADDWEVEEPGVLLTRMQIYVACIRAGLLSADSDEVRTELFFKELGL